jgi:hypothetical protein
MAAFHRERFFRDRWDFFLQKVQIGSSDIVSQNQSYKILSGRPKKVAYCSFKTYFKKVNTCHSGAHPSPIHPLVFGNWHVSVGACPSASHSPQWAKVLDAIISSRVVQRFKALHLSARGFTIVPGSNSGWIMPGVIGSPIGQRPIGPGLAGVGCHCK